MSCKDGFSWRQFILSSPDLGGIIVSLLPHLPLAQQALLGLNGAVGALSTATRAGTSFVFGVIGGGASTNIGNAADFAGFAFSVLPLVIVISALSALLWHWRVLPIIINAIAYVLRRVLGLGGAVGLGAGATIFLGIGEPPFPIRPYLPPITRPHLF